MSRMRKVNSVHQELLLFYLLLFYLDPGLNYLVSFYYLKVGISGAGAIRCLSLHFQKNK